MCSQWRPSLHPSSHGLVEIGTTGRALALRFLLPILEGFQALDGHPWQSENLTGPALLGPSTFLGQKGLSVHPAALPSVQHPLGPFSGLTTLHSYLPGLRSEILPPPRAEAIHLLLQSPSVPFPTTARPTPAVPTVPGRLHCPFLLKRLYCWSGLKTLRAHTAD